MDRPKSPPSPSVNRRGFFRRILLRGLEQAESTGQGVAQQVRAGLSAAQDSMAGRKGRPDLPAEAAPPRVRYLRPPGALPEPDFAAACSRCGKCVEVCPAQCIHMEEGVAGGLPHIIARESPCVVCTDLSCMKVCPTGALKLVDRVADIHMGVAVVDPARCLRTAQDAHPGDRACRVCVNQCPVGQDALAIDAAGQLVVRPGCIGCGVCEQACPTEPASIVVRPRTAAP